MKKTTKKRIIIYSSIVIAIVAIVLISGAISSNKEAMEQFDVTPSTSIASISDIGIYIPASGTITSGNTVSVLAETQGTIVETNFQLGDFVNAGDVIATVEGDTLEEQIESVQLSIDAQRASIDQYDNETQDYTIKAPVQGRVKEINVKYVTSDTYQSNRERAEEIEEEYGYLVSIAVGNSMYIKVTENIDQYEVGEYYDAVIHEDDGDRKINSGSYVEKIEDGAVYIYVNSNKYDDNASATVYTSDGKTELGEGVTEYPGMEYVVGAKGYIKATSTYINQWVNEGDILYYSYSNISQNLIDMYDTLEGLEEDLADLQTQYSNLEITAPVSGFLSEINIEDGNEINAQTSVCTVADTSIWTAIVDVDELDINEISVGMTAQVTIDAIPDEEFEGTVSRISSVGTNSGGVTSYSVEIELAADARFKLSMNASSEIQVEKVEDVVSVPIQAVRYQGSKAYVMVYVERTQEELKEIQNQILEAQETAEEMANMTQEELEEKMVEYRDKAGTGTGEKGKGSFDMKNVDPELMRSKLEGMGGKISSSTLSIADQLYGEMVFVEVGIQDETNIQIISGLSKGDVILLPINESSTTTTSAQGFAIPGFGMGGKR